MSKSICDLTDDEIMEIINDIYRDWTVRTENAIIERDRTGDRVLLKLMPDSPDPMTVVMCNPFTHGLFAINTAHIEIFDDDDLVKFEQFCFAKGVTEGCHLLDNPYLDDNNNSGKTGFWKPVDGYVMGHHPYQCPNCDTWCDDMEWKFCPNCGTRLEWRSHGKNN